MSRFRTRGSLGNDLSAGGLLAFLSASFSLSYAALLFAGTSPGTQAAGLVMMLTGGAVVAVVGTTLSTLRFSLLFADGTLVAMLAAVTGEIVADLRDAPVPVVTATLVVTLMLASLATGATLWLIGQARGGAVVRFIPFTMMAGVLAASGWSLSVGGAMVAIGHGAIAPDAILSDPAALARLLAALLVALVLLAVARCRHPAVLPAGIVGVVLLHHGIFHLLGWTPAAQRAAGWLLAVPPYLELAVPWSADMLRAMDWRVLASHGWSLLALIPVTAICVLLAIGGIETATGRDVMADRDLKANGIAAMAAGALGGVLGITSVSRTMLAYNLGARGPGASLVSGLAGGLVPLLWPELIGLVPRPVLGGLLLFTGIRTLHHWVVRSRRRLAWSEWLTVLAVLAMAARFGLVVGATAGLLLGCIGFAVIYSRASPVRARYGGDAARSRVDRSDQEEAWLAAEGDTLLVLHLQGFVFFGTASRLVEEVRRAMAARPGRLAHVVLVFSHVQGIDASALASLERLVRVTSEASARLAFAAVPAPVAARLAGVMATGVHRAPTLDAALEWREEAVLAGLSPGRAPSLVQLLAAEFDRAEDAAAFLALLEPVSFAPGDVLVRQGELSDDLLFLQQGRAAVTIRFAAAEVPMRVRSFGVGTMIGEIGFCLGLPRTATVTAQEPCRVLRLTRAAMDGLEARSPGVALAFQRAVLRRLGRRLMSKDQLISALMLDWPGDG